VHDRVLRSRGPCGAVHVIMNGEDGGLEVPMDELGGRDSGVHIFFLICKRSHINIVHMCVDNSSKD
jgi:hypothetical protein